MAKRLRLLIGLSLLCLGCKDSAPKSYTKSRLAMDTLVSLTLVAESDTRASAAFDTAFAEVARLEALLNFYSETSEISRINQNAGISPVRVSKDTLDLLDAALRVSAMTDGAFDVTIGAVTRLWDFKKGVVASESAVKTAMKVVGHQGLVLDRAASTAFLAKHGAAIDPGGITKGFVADRVAAVLAARGVKAGLIAMSGDIRAFGARPGGTPWEVGIRHPDKGPGETIAAVDVREAGVSTSGGYERRIVTDAGSFHHIFSPASGRSDDALKSVTVVAPTATESDALATAIVVMGLTKGLALVERLSVDAFLVDREGRIHTRERRHAFRRR
ncbi:MAG: FAD:protein FMN transferase [Deltaproteobacteria bacterium]|nr:FAD:protein FMN transferase [Deltaproteobacteria bacterium]